MSRKNKHPAAKDSFWRVAQPAIEVKDTDIIRSLHLSSSSKDDLTVFVSYLYQKFSALISSAKSPYTSCQDDVHFVSIPLLAGLTRKKVEEALDEAKLTVGLSLEPNKTKKHPQRISLRVEPLSELMSFASRRFFHQKYKDGDIIEKLVVVNHDNNDNNILARALWQIQEKFPSAFQAIEALGVREKIQTHEGETIVRRDAFAITLTEGVTRRQVKDMLAALRNEGISVFLNNNRVQTVHMVAAITPLISAHDQELRHQPRVTPYYLRCVI